MIAYVLVLFALVAACGSADDVPADGGRDVASAPEAGAADAGAPRVEIGVGQDAFEPVEEDQIVDLVSGPQLGGRFGGHHVFTALRMRGLAREALVRIEIAITSTIGMPQARTERDPARSPIQDDGMGELRLVGLTPRFEDCCAVAARAIVMRAEVEAADGTVYEHAVRVRASQCPASGPSICP